MTPMLWLTMTPQGMDDRTAPHEPDIASHFSRSGEITGGKEVSTRLSLHDLYNANSCQSHANR